MKLKPNSRLNQALRETMAAAAVNATFANHIAERDVEEAAIEKELVAIYFDPYNSEEDNFEAGLLPTVDHLTVPTDCMPTTIGGKHMLPFEVFNNELYYFDELAGEQMELRLAEFIKERNDLARRMRAANSKIMKFLGGFTSLAKLLEAAPDMGKYIPEEFIETGVDAQVSLTDILNEAA